MFLSRFGRHRLSDVLSFVSAHSQLIFSVVGERNEKVFSKDVFAGREERTNQIPAGKCVLTLF